MEGDTIEGKTICEIPAESRIAINASSEVGWVAWHAKSKDECLYGTSALIGLFVDSRFVKDLPFELGKPITYPFIFLSDDGQVSVLQAPPNVCSRPAPAVPASQQRGGGIRGIFDAAASALVAAA